VKTLKDLFSSKKFLVLLSALIVYVASRFGFDVKAETADKMLALVGVYLLGQGIADHGKGAVQIAAATAVPVVATPVMPVQPLPLKPPPLP
jgi:hypothetical protein